MDSAALLSPAPPPTIVSREEWLTARTALLAKEKALLREMDALAAERRRLPWVKVDKLYVFDTPDGPRTLADLFEGRSQLLIQHFMFGPEWEEGCVGCSFGADHMHGIWIHLENHDVKFAAVSRAPLAKIEAFKKRMGWEFDWVSSHGSEFNYDYHVSFTEAEKAANRVFYNFREDAYAIDELPGLSVFVKDDNGQVYHTYSCYARGTEAASGVFGLLDITPKGRNEGPDGDLSDWVRHHDKYDDAAVSSSCCKT